MGPTLMVLFLILVPVGCLGILAHVPEEKRGTEEVVARDYCVHEECGSGVGFTTGGNLAVTSTCICTIRQFCTSLVRHGNWAWQQQVIKDYKCCEHPRCGDGRIE